LKPFGGEKSTATTKKVSKGDKADKKKKLYVDHDF